MYFIASGAVEARVQPRPVRLGSGDFFGEIALLANRPRVADVVAMGYCRLLTLHRRDLETLFERHPDLRRHLDAVVHERLAQEG
jgi:CPA1 family monovalent cation:H+ antiporter